MPDNWNKLADLLGTPSIDPIDRKSVPPKQVQKTTVAEQDVAPKGTATGVGGDIAHPTTPTAESAKTSPPETKSRLKNTWDAVAEFFGVAAPTPAVEEPVVESDSSATIESHAAPKSFWQVEEDDHDRTQRASQRVSDELLGKRSNKAAEPEDDLERLLAGFRQRPEQATSSEETTNSVAAPLSDAPAARPNSRERQERSDRSDRGERNDRRPQRGERSERSRDANSRGGRADQDPADRNDRTESRRRRSEIRRAPDGVDEVASEPVRGRRRSSLSESARDSFTSDTTSESGTPERRGRRRPSRRAIAEGAVDKAPSDDMSAEFVERDDSIEDSTLDPSRRRQQRWSRDRGARNPRRETEITDERRVSRDDRDELPTRLRKTSAWEDPELVPLSEEDAELDIIDSEDGDVAGDGQGRRRRRRRRPNSKVDVDGTDEVATTGRQIYGRHADESEDGEDDVDKLRTAVIVPWVDAISVIVDKNMKNHRHAPPNTRGGRGGSPRGNGNRRPPQ